MDEILANVPTNENDIVDDIANEDFAGYEVLPDITITTEYEEEIISGPTLGTVGTRPSTLNGQSCGAKQYNNFVKYFNTTHRTKFPLFENASKDDFANVLIWQNFAHYLAKSAVKTVTIPNNSINGIEETVNGEPLVFTTALQYFSNILQKVLKMLPLDHSWFKQFKECPKGESPKFIKAIRDDIRSTMIRDLILKGIPIIIKPRGIGRVVLCLI